MIVDKRKDITDFAYILEQRQYKLFNREDLDKSLKTHEKTKGLSEYGSQQL